MHLYNVKILQNCVFQVSNTKDPEYAKVCPSNYFFECITDLKKIFIYNNFFSISLTGNGKNLFNMCYEQN